MNLLSLMMDCVDVFIQLSRYRTFAGPFGKVFLGAVFVYQVIYWSWLKLETDESKLEKNGESADYAGYSRFAVIDSP